MLIDFRMICIGDVLEFFVSPLEGSVVHKDVDGAERVDGFPRHSLGYEPFADIAGQENGFATGFGNETFGLLGIPIFGQIRNGNIRSLSCKGEGNRVSDDKTEKAPP